MKKILMMFAIIVWLSSCSNRMNCPTTNSRYFYQKMGIKNHPRMSKGKKRGSYGNASYIVPYKYRKGIPNYGKLK